VQSASEFLTRRLWELREAARLTQEEYAELAGIPYKVYQHIEAGRRRNPRLSTVEKLARGFGLTVNEFFAERLPKPKLRKRPSKAKRVQKRSVAGRPASR
jgi:transcriptional regulator with XRE-family HTH domain